MNNYNTEKSEITATPENIDRIYRFMLYIQESQEIDDLWKVFLRETGGLLPVKEAALIYQAGLLFERLELFNNRIIHRTLDRFSFIMPADDFEITISKKEMLVYKRGEGHTIQMEIAFEGSVDEPESINQSDIALLKVLSRIFANQLILLLRIKNFEFHSVKDDITLAYNQNYLKAFIHNEVERAKRYATIFSIIFFDLDNLKAINELHGHLVGTEVLKEVAEILRSQVRKVDLLSRFGGDEFVIVLLHAGAAKADEVCHRIKNKISQHVFLKNRNLNISITGCFGISSFPENGMSVEDLIRKADLAMYDVKRSGKNGVKIYEE